MPKEKHKKMQAMISNKNQAESKLSKQKIKTNQQ